MTTYRISQLAERSGVPATTLRYYESVGLLAAERTPAGYRRYDDEAVRRLEFISSAKLLGMALEDIATLVAVWEQGVCAAVRTRLQPLVVQRISEVEQRIAEMSAFSDHLAGVHEQLSGPAPAGACGPDCGCTSPSGGRDPVPVSLTTVRPQGLESGGAGSPEPIACTLGGDEVGERVREWQGVVERAHGRREIPGGLILTFPADHPQLAAEIAAAEQRCCAFFRFTLHLTPGALELTVEAPTEAQPLLADLFRATA